MRAFRLTCAGLALLLAAACVRPAPKLTVASAADSAAVTRTFATFDSCARTGAVDVFMSHMTDDVVLLAPEAPAVVGKAAVSEYYTKLFGAMEFDVRHTSVETFVLGDLVLTRGNASGTATPRAGGPAMPVSNKYLIVFRRQEDGSLKGWRTAANSNAPPAPPPPAPKR